MWESQHEFNSKPLSLFRFEISREGPRSTRKSAPEQHEKPSPFSAAAPSSESQRRCGTRSASSSWLLFPLFSSKCQLQNKGTSYFKKAMNLAISQQGSARVQRSKSTTDQDPSSFSN